MSQSPAADLRRTQYYQASFPPSHAQDVFLVTDGSGHVDGLTGSAAIWYSPKHRFFNLCTGGWTGSSVDRSEFEALLHGLHGITEWFLANGHTLSSLRANPKLVHWTNDRESLVLAVSRDPSNGESFYRRNINHDLWAQLEYYETLYLITGKRVPRNTTVLQTAVDAIAGEQRAHYKDYVRLWPATFSYFVDWLKYWEHPGIVNKEVAAMLMKEISGADLEEEIMFLDTRVDRTTRDLILQIIKSPEVCGSLYIPT